MKISLKKNNADFLFAFLIICFYLGLLYSRALLSVVSVLLVLLSCFSVGFKRSLLRLKKSLLFWLFLLFFIVYLTEIFRNHPPDIFINDFRNKIFLLLFPIAFIGLNEFLEKRNKFLLLIFFNFLVVLTGLMTFINYLISYHYYNQLLLQSKPIPIWGGLNHIYFGLILAFSTLSSFYILFFLKSALQLFTGIFYNLIRYLIFFSAIIGTLCLHTIAAKTGLLAFYVTFFIVVIYISIIYRKVLISLGIMVLALFVIFFSVQFIQPLKMRWLKLKEDIETYENKGNINYFSFSTRVEYWKASWQIFKLRPLTGVGNAEVENQLADYFARHNSVLNTENRLNPHNQYLHVLAGTGIIGFVLFLGILFTLLRETLLKKNLLGFILLLVCLSGFLFESVLERQAGICFFMFFIYFTDSECFTPDQGTR